MWTFSRQTAAFRYSFAPGPRICFIERTLVDRIFALHPIVHLNEDELCGFTGATALEEGAKALYALTENMVIVTHGAEGAYYYDGDEFIHVPPVKAVKVVDTIGAGGFPYWHCHGLSGKGPHTI